MRLGDVLMKRSGGVMSYDGSVWRSAGKPFPYQGSLVRCGSPTFCIGMDIYWHFSVWDGMQWSAPQGTGGIWNIACPQDGFCVGTGVGNYVYTYASGKWQRTGWLGKGRNGKYYGLACTVTITCTAINDLGYARTYSASSGAAASGPRVPHELGARSSTGTAAS
jgi:hypothetical protein